MTTATSRYLSVRTAIEAAVTGVLATLMALVVFGPIWSSMTSPLGSGDMLATYVNADNWGGFGYTTTTHYGFPHGMNLNYVPNIDITQNSFARIVDVFSGSPFLGTNLLLFVSFPLVAVLAYLLLRMVSRGGPVAIALAVAFTMIPFHFGRGLGHTSLATMYGAVTAVMLATVIGQGYLPRIVKAGSARRRAVTITLLVGLVVVTAWSGLYYAAFAIILSAAALVWRIARRDSWGRVAFNTIPVVSVAVLAIAGFIPGLLAVASNPPLAPLAERSAAESVTLAGNLTMAILPVPIGELPGMGRYNAAISQRIAEGVGGGPPVESNALTNYGTWITAAALVVFVLGWVIRSRRRTLAGSAVPFTGLLTAVTVLFFVPWGLNYLVASFVTAQIRGWNRLVPILLLLLVMGAMAALSRTRWDTTAVRTVVAAAAILVVVTTTQVMPFRAPYAQGAATGSLAAQVARDYSDQVNAAIPEHCAVLQLPYVQYPEQGVTPPELNDYEHFIQPLVNENKDFSYGAVKNTSASTQFAQMGDVPTSADIANLRNTGFCAIHVDRRGIEDNVWTFMQIDLTSALGEPVAVGNDGLWQLYDLRAK